LQYFIDDDYDDDDDDDDDEVDDVFVVDEYEYEYVTTLDYYFSR